MYHYLGTISPDGHCIETACLGSWLTTQRKLKGDLKLPPDRLSKLQALVDAGLYI